MTPLQPQTKIKFSVFYNSDTYDFIITNQVISKIILISDFGETQELTFDQVPVEVKRKLKKDIESLAEK